LGARILRPCPAALFSRFRTCTVDRPDLRQSLGQLLDNTGWVRLDGQRKVYERDADSGYSIRFHFCPNCGTTPPTRVPARGTLISKNGWPK
jgi:hypothetical protein